MALDLARHTAAARPATLGPRPAQQRSAWDSVDVLVVAGIVLVGVVAPALIALATHSLGIPRNDDWAFRRVLLGLTRTGHYSLVGWGSMTLVGQVLWAAPLMVLLGNPDWAPSLAVAVLAAAGLASAYLVARGQLGRGRAVVCTLLILSFPGFALSTSSFMTDVPAFSAEMVCLLLGVMALGSSGRDQLYWLSLSMAAGVFGFSVREFDIAAPAAVLVALAWADRRLVRACAASGLAVAAVCAGIYVWTATLPGAQGKVLGLPSSATWGTLGGVYFTLSFMVAPVLPGATLRLKAWRRPAAIVAAGVALAIGALLVARHHPLFIGNYLDQQGAGGNRVLSGTRPLLFPEPLWEVFRALALVAGVVFAGVLGGTGWQLVRGTRNPLHSTVRPAPGVVPTARVPERRLVLVFTWVSAAVLAGYGLFVRAAFWDRYLWPVAFGAAVLMVGSGLRSWRTASVGRWRPALTVRAFAWVSAALVGFSALAVTLNSDAYDAARWAAGQELVDRGYPASAVDAGFDWVGAHAGGVARPGRAVAGAPAYEMWYDQMFPGFKDCAVVSSSPLLGPSLQLLRTTRYEELGFAVPERLYVYLVDNRACGGASSSPGGKEAG